MPTDVAGFPEVAVEEAAQIRIRRSQALPKHPRNHGYLGIGLSGGGIRSATLNLGILQGLAQRGLLPYIDYLSTVSGGGYIGTWLHSVILRYGKGQPAQAAKLLSPKDHPIPGEPDQDPITFLRKYSSYLAPAMGLLSADFWVILVIWFRNMMLNQLILVSFLAFICLAAIHIGFLGIALTENQSYLFLLVLATLCTLSVIIVAAGGVRGVIDSKACNDDPYCQDKPRGPGNKGVGGAAVVTVVGAFLIACAHSWFAQLWQQPVVLIAFAIAISLMFAILQVAGGFLTCYNARKRDSWLALPIVALCSGVAGIVTSAMLVGCSIWMNSWTNSDAAYWHVVAWGPPLIMLIWLAGAGLHIGMMGGDFPDFAREWLARTGAYIVIGAFSWAVLFSLAVFGPQWISAFALDNGKKVAGLIGAWIATTAAGVFAGKSEKTSGSGGDSKSSGALEWIVKIAPAVFMIGVLLLVSFGVHVAIGAWNHPCEVIPPKANNASPQSVTIAVSDSTSLKLVTDGMSSIPPWLTWLEPINRTWWSVFKCADRIWVIEIVGIVTGVGLLLCWRVNINEFSMHHFYKNRLVRCYLGASRGKSRSPSRLTGFDSCDDLPLTMFLADPSKTREDCQKNKHNYYGPYPIINGTLNLDRGSELAKQERKGESFVFTPLYSGFDPPKSPDDNEAIGKQLHANGYRQTCGYMQHEGPGIGTCMAISGAAANPNWGYHTSPPVAFLLTVFDVRLGWWVGNPRRDDTSAQPGPRFALKPLLSELFAQTDARTAYMNISDGGHFENLGLYELVHRRCRYIIIGDGEEDPDLTFESLGGAVRKCRADFGVEIDIHPRRIRRKDGLSTVHCVVGTIHYPKSEQQPEDHGWILYLKSSLTGDEPEDVTQYQAVHSTFPHESTADQFFTESQFESYRRLGQHIVESAFGNVNFDENDPKGFLQDEHGLEHLFDCLYQQWYPPTEVADQVGTHHTEAYSALIKRLEDPSLKHLVPQIFCQKERDCAAEPMSPAAPDPRKEFFFCLDAIQLMENVWSDVRLFNRSNLENPRNGGWINVFRYWARQPAFQSAWKQASYTYNPLFQQFFDGMANSPAPQKQHPPCSDLPFKV
jgi:hypothetical protein